jgi:hypothetical protein
VLKADSFLASEYFGSALLGFAFLLVAFTSGFLSAYVTGWKVDL